MMRRMKVPLFAPVVMGKKKQTHLQKILATRPASLIGAWGISDPSGTTCTDSSPAANNGTYTNITLGQPGYGGALCGLIDNVADAISVVATVAGDFNGVAGTVGGLFKVANAGVWTDGVSGRFFRFWYNASNQVSIYKATASNLIYLSYIAGGTDKSVSYNWVSPSTDWFSIYFTWDASADQVKAFINGAQVGSTLTGLGTWTGTIVLGELGAGSGAAHLGWIEDCGLWTAALTPAEITNIGVL